MNKHITFVLLVATLFLSACNSTKPIFYQLDLPANDRFSYTQNTETEMDMQIMGMDQKNISIQNFDYEVYVKEKRDNGDMLLESTIKNLYISQQSAMASMTFDSENPEKNEPAEMVAMYEPMVGITLTSEITKNGEVKNIAGMDELFDAMLDAVPDNPMMPKEQLRSTLKTQFGDQAMSGMLQNISKIYPPKAVKVGDTWMKTDSLGGPIALIADITYTLKERKGGKSYIDLTSKLRTDPDADPMDMMGIAMSYELVGTQTGSIVLDEKSGWTDTSTIDQEMSGKMKMSGEMIGEMATDMQIKTKVVIEKNK